MANKPISMTKIRQFIRLEQQGFSQRKIARMLSIHRDTIRKYQQQIQAIGKSYEELLQEDDEVLNGLLDRGNHRSVDVERLNQLQSFLPYADKELGRVGVDKHNLWQEYKELFPLGYGYSHFCREYNRWKLVRQVSSHFEYKAGDKLFVDYTGNKLHIVDRSTGEVTPVEVLVAVLGHSHYTYVEATTSQKKEDFIVGIENALHYFDGVPQAIVTDNLKSAVTRSCKYEPQLNATFESFALHYRTTILPTRAYKPKDKAIVEGAVNIVYKRIFAPLRDITFFSLPELNAAIRECSDKHNRIDFIGKDHSRYTLFEQIEKQTLTPLPQQRYELQNYSWNTVHKNSHVYLYEDKHYYSVPYTHLSKKVKVVYNTTQVEIYYHHQRIAAHRRGYKAYGYTTLADHMPSANRFVSEWNPERFLSWAGDVGEPTRKLIEKIMETKSHPEQAYKACVGVLSFAKKIGNERLNKACDRALHYQNYSYQVVKRILCSGLEEEPAQAELLFNIPTHQNVRGQNYYQ
jgi:transposase